MLELTARVVQAAMASVVISSDRDFTFIYQILPDGFVRNSKQAGFRACFKGART